jgi:hypothetical protein
MLTSVIAVNVSRVIHTMGTRYLERRRENRESQGHDAADTQPEHAALPAVEAVLEAIEALVDLREARVDLHKPFVDPVESFVDPVSLIASMIAWSQTKYRVWDTGM